MSFCSAKLDNSILSSPKSIIHINKKVGSDFQEIQILSGAVTARKGVSDRFGMHGSKNHLSVLNAFVKFLSLSLSKE